MSTLAERLLEAIDATGLDPDKLGKVMKVSRQSVYAWKRGEGIGQIKAYNLVALSELSGLDPVWILKGKGNRRRGETLNETEAKLLELFRGCDVRGRNAILRTAEQEREYAKELEYTGPERRISSDAGYSGKDRRKPH